MKRVFIFICLLVNVGSVSAQLSKLKPLKDKKMVGQLVPMEKNGKWGYGLQREGKDPKNVVKYLFDEAYDFVDSIAIVKYGGKYGMLHRSGIMAVEPIYEETTGFVNKLTLCRKENEYVVLSSQLKEICHWTLTDDDTYSFRLGGVPFIMRLIKKGKFLMGIDSQKQEFYYDAPAHEVQITKDYYIGEYEVAHSLYHAVMFGTISTSDFSSKAKTNVSWSQCNTFIEKLGHFFPCFEFCIPSEAEWEYACLSGKRIQNMTGGVEEWCYDWYNSNYYNVCPLYDPVGPSIGKGRVVRGVCWKELPNQSAYRTSHDPDYKGDNLGFRLVMKKKFDMENGTLKDYKDFLEELSSNMP